MIDIEQLLELLRDHESDRVEMTVSTTNVTKFGEAICAFSNDMANHGRPGYLIIGVDDNARVAGVDITDQVLQNIASLKDSGQISPMPTMSVGKFDLQGGSVAVVEVHPSPLAPVRYKGVTHIRVGPRRARASAQDERVLIERRVDAAKTWDARPCLGTTLEDLSLDLFKLEYLPNTVDRDVIRENGRDVHEQLAALRMFDSASQCPTNVAILLFGKNVTSFVPGAYIQYVKYDGTSQAANPIEELRMENTLAAVLRELDLLAKRISRRYPVRQDDLRDRDFFLYPEISLHEIFMNAVIHRNYDGSGSPVQINEFSDRIEITNPGSLYGDLSLDHFPGGTSYRNPLVADSAKALGFVNRFGRGVSLTQRHLADNGSNPAVFRVGENHFQVMIEAKR